MFEQKPPIRSTQEDVIELADDINRFVIGLSEQIDSIQDAELTNDYRQMADLAGTLARDAERLGYPALAQMARTVASAAEDAKPEAVQEANFELTELAQRVRRGHRGAA
jgi:HPt (histidine-containing phosphotransfer) domain-containing protein